MTTEVSHPTAECPHPEQWHMHDDNSAEVEVGDFIRALVEMLKPRLVVETGTHLGQTASKIACALEYNHISLAPCVRGEVGRLITCDINHHEEAARRTGLFRNITYRIGSSLDLEVEGQIDILFCDSDPRIRIAEIEHFWPHLGPHSIILVHDVNTGCHHQLREELASYPKVKSIFLPTPRGLAICQKA